MEDYLIKKQHDEHTIARVMEKLIEYGLLDDEQYAQRYVQTRKDTSGKYLLRQKMKMQGLSSDVIDEAVGAIPFEDQVAVARALIDRKMAGDEREDALRRAVQSVMRRGFAYDVVRAAADQYKEDLEWEE